MTLLDLIAEYVKARAQHCEVSSDLQRTVARVWFAGQREPRHFIIQSPPSDAVLTAFEVREVELKQWPPARNAGGQMMISM